MLMLQVVDLSALHGPNYLALSAKARREFLFAIQEAVNIDFSSSAERRSVTQLVMKLHQIWGKAIIIVTTIFVYCLSVTSHVHHVSTKSEV